MLYPVECRTTRRKVVQQNARPSGSSFRDTVSWEVDAWKKAVLVSSGAGAVASARPLRDISLAMDFPYDEKILRGSGGRCMANSPTGRSSFPHNIPAIACAES